MPNVKLRTYKIVSFIFLIPLIKERMTSITFGWHQSYYFVYNVWGDLHVLFSADGIFYLSCVDL